MELLSKETVKNLCDYIRKDVGKTVRKDAICDLLNTQRQDGRYCDVTIECKGKLFNSHKCLLGGTTDFFNTSFSSPLSPVNASTINFSDFSIETVSLLLDIVYGKVSVEKTDDVVELLRIAEFIQYSWLVEMLVKAIRITIDNTNVFVWYGISEQCGVEKLKILTESYIRKNYDQLFSMDVYPDLYCIVNLGLSQTDFKKEVLFSIVNDKKEIYTIDINSNKNPCKKYLGEMLQLYNVSANYKSQNGLDDRVKLWLLFMHKNELFVVTEKEEYNYCRFQYEGKSLSIYKYQHLSQTFKMVYCKSIDGICQHLSIEQMMVFQEVAYDNVDSLYILLSDADSILEEEQEQKLLLLKYDITTGNLCDTYVSLCSDRYMNFLLVRKEVGLLVLLDVTCIYDIKNFGIINQTPKKVTINSDSICQESVASSSWFKVVDLDGAVYSFVKFGRTWDRHNMVYHVLKLNIEELVWDHLCDINFYCIFNSFSFQSKIFIFGIQDGEITRNRDTNAKLSQLCEFHPDKNILTVSDITLELGGFPDHFLKVPSYILV